VHFDNDSLTVVCITDRNCRDVFFSALADAVIDIQCLQFRYLTDDRQIKASYLYQSVASFILSKP